MKQSCIPLCCSQRHGRLGRAGLTVDGRDQGRGQPPAHAEHRHERQLPTQPARPRRQQTPAGHALEQKG